MTTSDLYDRCVGMDWGSVRAALADLDGLTAAEATAAWHAVGGASRPKSKADALARIRRAVLDRKGAAERVML